MAGWPAGWLGRPTMVFRRASTAMHMNGMKMITSQLYLVCLYDYAS